MSTVVVTGADRGVGLSLVEQLAAKGDRVFATCLDVDGAALRAVAERFSGCVEIVRLDVGDAASVRLAVSEIRSLVGALDRVINNAGILGDIEHSVGDPEFDPDGVLDVFRINALGALRVTHELWDLLMAGGEKLVVNISSEAGSVARNWRDRWFGYAMSKAALNMEGALIHRRLAEFGGRVMQVHPGYVRSYMHGAKNEKATHEADEAARLVLAAIEQRRSRPRGEQPDYFDLHGEALPW